MSTRERLLTALSGGQPDRVPVSIFLNPYDPSDYRRRDRSYDEVFDAVEKHGDPFHSEHGLCPFMLTAHECERSTRVLPDGAVEVTLRTPAGPLVQVTRPGGRGQLKRFISNERDLDTALSIPYEPLRPDLSEFSEALERLGDRVLGQVVLMDPACTVGWLDETTAALWSLEQPHLLRRLLDVAFERLKNLIDHLLDQDAGPVYYFNGPEYCIPPLMAPQAFHDYVARYDTELVARIHERGKLTIIHSHGKVNQFLEAFADIGTDGLNVLEPPPMGDIDLADAKRRVGDRMCLIGNVQYDPLARGSLAEVEALVREAIENGAPGGGFILAPCASPYEVPLPDQARRNLIHMLQSAHRWGQY